MVKYCILFSCICHYLLIAFSNYIYFPENNINVNNQNSNQKNINVSLVNANITKNKAEIPQLELQKEQQNNTKKISKENTKKANKKVIRKKSNNSENIKQVKKDNWQNQIRKQFNKLKKQHLFYPLAAIQNNIEGVVEVKIFLDNNGNVIISRIENSSGYEILDNAALRAVKTIKSLEENAPREFILPVRFSLK